MTAAGFADSARARQFVRTALQCLPHDFVATAELLTSEVVTNALVHATDEAVLTVDLDTERLRVEVADPNSNTDFAPKPFELDSEHGRGLAIVNALASSWGVEGRSTGKAVWFELARVDSSPTEQCLEVADRPSGSREGSVPIDVATPGAQNKTGDGEI